MREQKNPEIRGMATRSKLFAVAATCSVFLVAMMLRPPITSVGPLLGQIGDSFGLGESALGTLGAAPLLAFAIFSPLAPRLVTRFGIERTILAALAIIAVGIVVRSYTGLAGLIIGMTVVGLGVAIGNVLVPALVKRDFSQHTTVATAIYTSCMTVAASIASGIAVPVAGQLGWQNSLAVWALPTVIVMLLWVPRVRHAGRRQVGADKTRPRLQLRSREAWLVTIFMGLQSTSFYIMITWLPTIAVESGASETQSGFYLFLFQVVGLVSGLAVPYFMRKPHSQVGATVGVSVPLIVCVAGVVICPELMPLWVVIGGVGSGAAFVVALSLISLRGSSPEETARLSGMAQSLGYLMAAIGPIAAGALAETTGAWTAPLIGLGVLCLLQLVVAVPAGRPRAAAVATRG